MKGSIFTLNSLSDKDFFSMLQICRDYFLQEKMLEVTPRPIIDAPCIEPHIPYMSVQGVRSKKTIGPLHTSPEFEMKKFISNGLSNIFTFCYVFRDEPSGPFHAQQFLMCEWYKAPSTLQAIKKDILILVQRLETFCNKSITKSIETLSLKEEFSQLGLPFSHIQKVEEFFSKIKALFPQIPLKKNLLWEDYFFLVFLNLIEPKIIQMKKTLFLTDYPFQLAALSQTQGALAKRFEFYYQGVEIANCYKELIDPVIQQGRVQNDMEKRMLLYKEKIPYPHQLIDALKKGLPENLCGIALGVERLFNLISKK